MEEHLTVWLGLSHLLPHHRNLLAIDVHLPFASRAANARAIQLVRPCARLLQQGVPNHMLLDFRCWRHSLLLLNDSGRYLQDQHERL